MNQEDRKTNKDYLKTHFGAAFKEARQARGLSQIHVAKVMDVSRYTIARFEDGNINVLSTFDILILAEYLGIKLAIHPNVGDAKAIHVLNELGTGWRFVYSPKPEIIGVPKPVRIEEPSEDIGGNTACSEHCFLCRPIKTPLRRWLTKAAT